ncbi:MAG: transglutaminase family protein [Planctomycetia bacterium]|nr:transglutaminase family protein [Planctomycetia bacterium]
MFFHVKHVTRYDYSSPVYCEPLTVRLRPRDDAAQRLLSYHLGVAPAPVGRSEFQDLDGNVSARVWFAGRTERLRVTSEFVVETLRANAYDFLLDPASVTLPLVYPAAVKAALLTYCVPPAAAERVSRLAKSVVEEAGGRTVPFLSALAARVRASCQTRIREHGAPWPAERTLAEGTGSCRDLAVVFNEACRAVGIAARFVSGYQQDDAGDQLPQLHAWSEVYLPGAGWRGFDPAKGLAVADRHVALAAAAHSADAAPTSGTFRATGATSRLTAEITVHVTAENPCQSQAQQQLAISD